jgi:hypothetical protein
MKTQTQILGLDKNEKKKIKPTVIDQYIDDKGGWVDSYYGGQPEYMTLLCFKYFENGDDLILLHTTKNPSETSADTIVCRGQWNDGVWAE